MSATGRNLVGHERRADDYYSTPDWCTRALLKKLPREALGSTPLDPCAGTGAILRELRAAECGQPIGIEVDPQRCDAVRGAGFGCLNADALAGDAWPWCSSVVTNPPYALAMQFIERSLREVQRNGLVVMLLRLNFLGSQKRAAFHRAHPSDIYVLPRRPSFTGGGTDATEYAWFAWGPGAGGRWTMLDCADGGSS